MLERLGFAVLTASDGLEAVRVFQEHKDEITIVLLDSTMPHLDGEQTFRELRRLQADIKVILCSGYNEQEAIQQFAGKGLAGFIHKPYTPRMLTAQLRTVLEA